MAKTEFTPSAGQLKFAFEYLHEEMETLAALSIALVNQLAPSDPDNDDDCENPTAWRLSQVLSDRLTCTHFSNDMRKVLLGGNTPHA